MYFLQNKSSTEPCFLCSQLGKSGGAIVKLFGSQSVSDETFKKHGVRKSFLDRNTTYCQTFLTYSNADFAKIEKLTQQLLTILNLFWKSTTIPASRGRLTVCTFEIKKNTFGKETENPGEIDKNPASRGRLTFCNFEIRKNHFWYKKIMG